MDKRQISTLLVLKELNIPRKLDSFNQRLVIQKSIYLAQEIGAHLGYYYSWYLKGPYASSVARDLFSALEEPNAKTKAALWSLDPKTEASLRELRPILSPPSGFSEKTGRSQFDEQALWLELIASIHFLVSRRQVSPDCTEITGQLRQVNKHYSDPQVKLALECLSDHKLLDG